MHVSYRWLGRHVDLSDKSAEDVARDLTLHVCEVEGVERFAPHLDDVVVGHVLEREPHPDADKLSVCRVDGGGGEPHTIVCGAPNVAAGQRIALARVGTRLPGDFKIKKAKIRGVASEGMICSERELDLGDEHDGIWVLPEDSPVGAPVAEAVGAVDWVLEVDNKAITHRPDLWGHRGIARELAALWGRPLLPLDTSLPETGAAAPFPVRIESPGCSRYLALPIDGARVEPSPTWLKLLLLAAGQRPLDVLVDLSNFVMLDLGQPNHLFDRGRISAEGIVVRDAREGESMETLDGETRRLRGSDLLICSGEEPVALAGIMGGEGSKVAAGTSRLLLEVAAFHAVTVRRTATRLGLRTDASARFEKSLDPGLPGAAAGHLVRLLQELQPAVTLPAPATDAGEWEDPSLDVPLRPERVRALLGVEMPDAEIARVLESLGFGLDTGAEPWKVRVPSARATKDVRLEEDLVEEVGRVHGYGRIETRPLPAELRPVPMERRRAVVRRVQDRLSGAARFHEALTYSFVSEPLLRAVGALDEPHVEVTNPFAEGWQRVRRSVLPSLLGRLGTNLREREEVRFFEIGKGTRPETLDERDQPAEVHELALVWAAPRPGPKARFDADRLSALKAVLEDLVRALEAGELAWERPAGEVPGWVHPGRCLAGRLDGVAEPVVLAGTLEPGVARALELDADVAGAVVSIDALVELPARPRPFRPIPRFPGVKVDVALAVDAATPAGDVRAVVEQSAKGLAREIELFDLYAGEQVGAGRKSLAFHVLLQARDRTLDDKDVAKFLGRLERAAERIGGELRRE